MNFEHIDVIWVAQVLGFVSFALGISTFYQKNDRKLKIVMLVFNFNHLLHYLLLGSYISAFATALSALRTATSIYTASKYVALLFIGLNIGLGAYLADAWTDILPILGAIAGTTAVFLLRGIQMRLAFLLGAVCWLSNNIIIGSIGGTLLESTLICVNISTIYRLLKEQRQAV